MVGGPASPPPSTFVTPRRRLQSTVEGSLLLPTPSPAVCDGVNAALTAWRSAGCPPVAPSMARAPRGILRTSSASAAPRQYKHVRFNIPSPRIQDGAAPSSLLRLQAASHRSRSLPRSAASSQDSKSTSLEGIWTLVLSRRARSVARRAACQDGVSMSRRTSKGRNMTVAHLRSRDAHGDGAWPAPAAARAAAAAPCQLRPPPPPATLPPGFTPAFLGWGKSPRVPTAGSGSRGQLACSPPPAREWAAPTRLQSSIQGSLDLDTSSPADCAATNAALSSWRQAGCPSSSTFEAAPVGILRTASNYSGPASPRPRRSVRFNVPAPRIQDESSSSPTRLHGRSHRPSPPSLATGGSSRDSQRDAAVLRFKRRTEGKCARCLAPLRHHSSGACRDPVRCLACDLSGHRERCCPLRLAAKIAKTAPAPPPPPPRRPSTSPLRPGAPSWAVVAATTAQDPPALPPPPPTQARHDQSAPTSSTSSDLALGNQEHAHPAMDVCFSTLASRVLASERCYKMSVDDVLSAENERTDLGLLQMQGKVGVRKTAESEVLLCLSTAATGEVMPEVSRPALECSPLMSTGHPLLSPDAGLTALLSPDDTPYEGGHPSVDVESVDGLTMVLISPGDALCDGGFSSEDDEDEEMEQLLPCLANLDQQELLLDGEEVGDWARREFQPVADVFDADVEVALLTADTEDDADDDVAADSGGTAPSSGTVIRCVADLFSRPAVPLLPTPTPPMPCAPAALPAPDRRSSRLATKPQLPAVDKAQYVLHKKMGLDFGDMPLVKATREFANICKSRPFSASAIDGLNTLFRLKLPSMTALDEALIGLAGPGGCDIPPPAALEVSV